MNSQLLSWIPLFFNIKLLLLALSAQCSTTPDELYNSCKPSFSCRDIAEVRYPFRRREDPVYCGYPGLELDCGGANSPTIEIMHFRYHIKEIDQLSQVLTIVREDVILYPCPNSVNTTMDNDLFDFYDDPVNLTFFKACSVSLNPPEFRKLNCNDNEVFVTRNGDKVIQNANSSVHNCLSSVVIPVSYKALAERGLRSESLDLVLNEGFKVRWKVNATACSDCICIYNNDTRETTCASPSRGSAMNGKLKYIIGFGAAGFGIFIICCMFLFMCKCCRHNCVMRRRTNNERNIEAFIMEYGSSIPKRYTYSEIRKMTKSFQEKLGQGGFGSVFKGKLSDDRLVAVKVFKSFKGNGEEFINEVASISRTSHVNIVSLLGFCYEGQTSALVYEFMPNGSLERFIHRDVSMNTEQQLGVERLYEIALGIARGLEYLHHGCNTHILHLDIKPHNILLDEDFQPKVADFGLAKLYSRKETIVSMLEARGTIGYIAPEVLMRNIGRVSHKSDVYSYGMTILEMVGGRKNVNAGVDHTSEIYFPHWIYKRLEEDDVKLEGLETVGENGFIRKMILVGLWCIQTEPSQRPSMSKVIELLEGSTEAIQVPPKPLFFSPLRSPEITSATSASRSM